MGHPLWPVFDLRIRTSRLELRLATDDDIAALAELARGGLHDPDVIPFTVDFCHKPSPAFEHEFIQYHWSTRSNWQPGSWDLALAVVHDGEVIGTQGLRGIEWDPLREVDTGSWLGRDVRGRGLGREMRAAVLEFAFTSLGATRARSGARSGNEASLGVSRSLGYVDDGRQRVSFGGQVDDEIRLRLEPEAWVTVADRPTVRVEGFDACRSLFGLD